MADGSGPSLMTAWVDIQADTSQFDAALEKLPSQMANKAQEAADRMRAEFARNALEIKQIMATYDKGPIQLEGGTFQYAESDSKLQQLAQANADLARKIGLVEGAVAKKAAAMSGASEATTRYAASIGALATKTQSVHTGMESIQKGTSRAGYGFLMLGQMVDDAQYGFKSVVNNIPGVVMSLGGSAGLAGALGISGVAINTWVKNWDDAKEAFGDTAVFQMAQDAISGIGDAALTTVASLVNLSNTPLTSKDLETWTAFKDEEAKRKKQAEKTTEAVEKIGKDGDSKRATSFREAVEKYGGGKKLLADAQEAQEKLVGKAPSDEIAKKRKTAFALTFKDAMAGEENAIRGLGTLLPKFGRDYQGVSPETKEREKASKKNADYALQEQNKADAAEKQRIDKLNQQHEKETKAIVDSLTPSIGNLLLDRPGRDVTDEIKNRLKRSGYTSDDMNSRAYEIGEAIRKNTIKDIKSTALKEGVTPEIARERLLKRRVADQRRKALALQKKVRGKTNIRKSERFGSTKEFLDKIQTSALNMRNKDTEVTRRIDKTNDLLATVATNTSAMKSGAGAKFAPKR